MFLKKPKHKNFDYVPRFYDPKKDEEERRKRKLGFRRNRTVRKKGKSSLYWFLIFVLVAYLYLRFKGII